MSFPRYVELSSSSVLSQLKAEFGAVSLDYPSKYAFKKRVNFFIKHPKFDAQLLQYDLAVIILNETVRFSEYVSPIKLPSNDTTNDTHFLPNLQCKSVGWNLVRMKRKNFTHFLKHLRVYTNIDCFQTSALVNLPSMK